MHLQTMLGDVDLDCGQTMIELHIIYMVSKQNRSLRNTVRSKITGMVISWSKWANKTKVSVERAYPFQSLPPLPQVFQGGSSAYQT